MVQESTTPTIDFCQVAKPSLRLQLSAHVYGQASMCRLQVLFGDSEKPPIPYSIQLIWAPGMGFKFGQTEAKSVQSHSSHVQSIQLAESWIWMIGTYRDDTYLDLLGSSAEYL